MENFEEIIEHQALASEVGRQAQVTAAAQYYLEEKQKSLAETQLEVETIINNCYHLLKQDVLKPDKNGKLDWFPTTDMRRLVFTDEGTEKLLQLINFYINKSNLLSNFDEDEIKRLMKTFMTELNDLILLKYEVLFRQPTFEECKKIILERVEEQVKMKVFAGEVIGIESSPNEIREKILSEMEKRVEYEFKKVRHEQRKEKLREYGLILAELEVIVFGALNRAYMGEERGSIRRHQNVSEIVGMRPQAPKEQGGVMKWLKG